MSTGVNERVNKHRASLRAAGLRPIQIWVPDIKASGFAEECHRQSVLAAQNDSDDEVLMDFMDEALADLDGWKA